MSLCTLGSVGDFVIKSVSIDDNAITNGQTYCINPASTHYFKIRASGYLDCNSDAPNPCQACIFVGVQPADESLTKYSLAEKQFVDCGSLTDFDSTGTVTVSNFGTLHTSGVYTFHSRVYPGIGSGVSGDCTTNGDYVPGGDAAVWTANITFCDY